MFKFIWMLFLSIFLIIWAIGSIQDTIYWIIDHFFKKNNIYKMDDSSVLFWLVILVAIASWSFLEWLEWINFGG